MTNNYDERGKAMSTRLEDEIKRQLDEGRPVDVSEDGEILPPQSTVTGARGTPVNPLTGKPTTRLKPQRWYSGLEDNPGRLLLERKAMNERFPNFQLIETTKGLCWTGYLRPQGTKSYRVALYYSSNFPYSSPEVWIIEPKIEAPKHQLSDGHLCLMKSGDQTWQTNSTAATIMGITSTWLWCYEYHQRHCGCSSVPCSQWPGKEA